MVGATTHLDLPKFFKWIEMMFGDFSDSEFEGVTADLLETQKTAGPSPQVGRSVIQLE